MRYVKYYTSQRGGSIADIGDLYKGPVFVQKGHGVGSFFNGLVRYLKPVFTSGLSALKEQSLKSGQAIIRDLGHKAIPDILKEQTVIAAENLANKAVNKLKRKLQEGSGRTKRKIIKGGKKRKFNHSSSKRRTTRLPQDIFK